MGRLIIMLLIFACAGCTQSSMHPLPPNQALDLFNQDTTQAANLGYTTLFDRGALSIPVLLGNLDNNEPFAGDVHQDPKYSYINLDLTKGLASLYLIEAIRVARLQPHETPLLVDTAGVVMPPNAFQQAADAYRSWWRSLPDTTTQAVQTAPDPLGATPLRWK